MARRHKKNRASPPPPPPVAAPHQRFPWKWIAWPFATGIGLYASYLGVYQFWAPNLVVTTSLEVDLDRPNSARFVVTNNNPVLEVTFVRELAFHRIKGVHEFLEYEAPGTRSDLEPPIMSAPHPPVTLHANEAETIDLEAESMPFRVAAPIEFADIVLIVRYHVSWLPLENTRYYRFVTDRGVDGKLHWVPKAEPDHRRTFEWFPKRRTFG